jgi:serine/threonine protein kinase
VDVYKINADTPFWGGESNSNTILYQQICSGSYQFDPQFWDLISKDAKNFIEELLLVKPDSRMTASQTLAHPWLSTTQSIDLLPTVKKNFDAKRTFKKGFCD